MLEPFSIAGLSALVSTVCISLTACIVATCRAISHSRCTKIRGCCCSCERDVMKESQVKAEEAEDDEADAKESDK